MIKKTWLLSQLVAACLISMLILSTYNVERTSRVMMGADGLAVEVVKKDSNDILIALLASLAMVFLGAIVTGDDGRIRKRWLALASGASIALIAGIWIYANGRCPDVFRPLASTRTEKTETIEPTVSTWEQRQFGKDL